MPQGHGVSIIPKFGMILPEDMYNEKMMKGQIGANGVEYTEEEMRRMSGIGEIQQEGGQQRELIAQVQEQVTYTAPVTEEMRTEEREMANEYVSSSGIDWSKVENE